MNCCDIWRIREKYKNLIFPNLPVLIINYINDNHYDYLKLVQSKNISINNLLYYLRNKEFKNELELLAHTLEYIKLKNGISK